jgi:hypothetical protein
MEAADWALLSDQELLERRIRELKADANALRTTDETADQGFQILDQLESDGPAKAR